MTDRNQDKKDDFIFGLRPVIEAIEAGKTIDKIFIRYHHRTEKTTFKARN